MTKIGQSFGLSHEPEWGVFCGENGAFVGGIPLLKQRNGGRSELGEWWPRSLFDLNRDLSLCYGLPIEFNSKMSGLEVVSRALNRCDLIHAQIATLHLRIPDPPLLTKSQRNAGEIIDLASRLQASGLLKIDWDPSKHPRWPTGSPGSIGGEFAPVGQASGSSTTAKPSVPATEAQLTIPVPFELPGGIPFPSEIVPPLTIPNISPVTCREIPIPTDLSARKSGQRQ